MAIEKSAGLILICNNKIFLAHPTNQKKTVGWQFPKGHIDDGETAFKAAKRETFEEVGINFENLNIDYTKLAEKIVIEYKNNKKEVFKTVTGYVLYLETLPSNQVNYDNAKLPNGQTEMDDSGWFTKEEAEPIIFWRMKPILNFLNNSENE